MKAFYDSKPAVFSAVGNGSYLYRYNIQEEEVEQVEQETTSKKKTSTATTKKQFSCQEVTVWSPVSSDKIFNAVLTDKYDKDYEQKLLNDYYSAQLGLYDEAEAKEKTEAYKTFLQERQQLHAQVDSDCKTLGID